MPDGSPLYRYGHLYVIDATGRTLPAHFQAFSTPLQYVRILVDDCDAVYPIIIDPLIEQRQKLTASDAASGDYFGSSVAIDGNTCLVGNFYKNSDTGAAYVFTCSGTTWTQQQILTASDGAYGDRFGKSVALQGDTCIIGAFWAGYGAAYVFMRSGTTWTQQQKLTANDNNPSDPSALFGTSVALDGDTCVIGATSANGNASGRAYVFTRSGTIWTQQQRLTADNPAIYDAFGISTALQGNTCIIGTLGENNGAGAAYIFTHSGATWIQQQKLTPNSNYVEYFGYDVSLDKIAILLALP